MIKRFSLVFSLVLFLMYSSLLADSTRKMVRIDLTGQPEQTVQQFLQLGVDITRYDKPGGYVNALINDLQLQQISDLGFKTAILIPDADAFARQLRQDGYLENFRTYDQMLLEMQNLAANYPEIVKLDSIGESYERTVGRGGYIIWAMKISDNVEIEEDEPEVYYFANIHAREIITPEIIMYFMHYLVENYGTDPYVTYLVNKRQIWLSPTVNPDGHEYVFTGSNINNDIDPVWWRKNKQDNNNNGMFDPPQSGAQPSPDGVDLNRNFGYQWGYDNSGSSPNPSSDLYRGSGPFSEPESQAIRNFVNQHRFLITVSFHSYHPGWLIPWGYIKQYTPDHQTYVVLADSCTAYNGYNAGCSWEVLGSYYVVNGDTDDWLYGEQQEKNKIFAFTPEVGSPSESIGGSGFFPDIMYIEKQVLENQGPLLYLAYAAGEEPIIEPQLVHDSEDPVGPYQVNAQFKNPIVLTEEVALDESSFTIYYNTTGAPPFDSTSVTFTGITDKYIGYIPGQGNGVTIYYYFKAADVLGRTGFSPRLAPAKLYSFNVGSDDIPPEIEHKPISNQSIYTESYTVKAIATDNSGIASVKLYYRQNGGVLDSLEMTPTETADEYEGVIVPDTVNVGDLFEYKIVATDISFNLNTTVEPAEGFHSFYVLSGFVFDFELDNGGFTTNTPSDWQWGSPTVGPLSAFSGKNVWATSLKDNYSNLSNSFFCVFGISPLEISYIKVSKFLFATIELSNCRIVPAAAFRGLANICSPAFSFS